MFVALLAASAYKAAGGPFSVVPDAAGTVISFLQSFLKGVTMPALALCVLIFMLFKKLTTKQVGITALLFFYIATGAGGTWAGVTMPALALCVLIFMLFKKLTTKQVGITALLFFYIATGAGGTWAYLADAIENARAGLQ
ncbi:hypothetical protein [Streptomyces sp. EN23]|uniref:hypothetical protein n=1 Tax=Streptomyces sp. EN23 TaxID=212774 RepID=UPI0008516BA7|nr:hypothetical protein [Streptomyces sp. EN23]